MTDIRLTEKQIIAWKILKNNRAKYVLYGGAAGGGKSFFGCVWLLANCLEYEGSRWLMGRAVLKTLKETTLNTFFDLTSSLGIKHLYTYNQTAGVIYFKNGSEILLKDLKYEPSDPNYSELGSLEICGAFIDEANQIQHACFEIIKTRCRYKLNEFGLLGQILMSCNPSKEWLYSMFYTPFKEGVLEPNKAFVQSLATDNINLPAAYIETLNSLTGVMRSRLLDGDWDYEDDDNRLIPHAKALDYFTNEFVQRGAPCITADIARFGKDKTVIRVWLGLVCVKVVELEREGTGVVSSVIKDLATTYRVPMSYVCVDSDGVGGGVADTLSCAEFVNGSRPIGDDNYKNLKTQCYYLAANLINLGKMYEQEQRYREEVISDMNWVRRWNIDSDGKLQVMPKDKIREATGRSPDHWDSIAMRMYLLLLGV